MHQMLKIQYQSFLNKASVALQKVISAESIVLLGDFNSHKGNDNKTWKGVIIRQGDFEINRNEKCLLLFCVTNELCIMNTFFSTRRFTSTLGIEIWWNSILSSIFVLSQ